MPAVGSARPPTNVSVKVTRGSTYSSLPLSVTRSAPAKVRAKKRTPASNCPAFSTNGALIPLSVLRRSFGAGELDAAAGGANAAIADAASATSIANRSVPARMRMDMEVPFRSHPVYAVVTFALLRRASGIVSFVSRATRIAPDPSRGEQPVYRGTTTGAQRYVA